MATKTWKEVELNRKKLESGKFTWDDLPPHIQEQVLESSTIYVLKPGEWVMVGGYRVKLVSQTTSNSIPSKIVVKYPADGDFYWLKVIFATFRRRTVWMYDSCRVPFSDIFICRWEVGDSGRERKYLAVFRQTSSGPSTG